MNSTNIQIHRSADPIRSAFQKGKAFIPFVTCGDPDLETTKAVVRSMAANGADLIELGIPFSDPTAEGPAVQAANLRALTGGVTADKIFDMVKELRHTVAAPMVFVTYANVVFSYGAQRFISACAQIGINGLILPDLPFEEKGEFSGLCREYGVALISLIAPTSKNRIAAIAKEAEGFLYIVSSPDAARSKINTDITSMVKLAKQNTSIPCAVSFGSSTPEQAAKMADICDGAIAGSAIVRLTAEYGKEAADPAGRYVRKMKDALSLDPA